jgi:hypothetical protein
MIKLDDKFSVLETKLREAGYCDDSIWVDREIIEGRKCPRWKRCRRVLRYRGFSVMNR